MHTASNHAQKRSSDEVTILNPISNHAQKRAGLECLGTGCLKKDVNCPTQILILPVWLILLVTQTDRSNMLQVRKTSFKWYWQKWKKLHTLFLSGHFSLKAHLHWCVRVITTPFGPNGVIFFAYFPSNLMLEKQWKFITGFCCKFQFPRAQFHLQ